MKERENKILIVLFLLGIIIISPLNAQVTIGSGDAPQNFSILEIVSNSNGGVRLPQLTTTERDLMASSAEFKSQSARGNRASSKALGLLIYNLDNNKMEVWDGVEWQTLGSDNTNTSPPVVSNILKITVGSNSFTATLADNATATAFKALLPMTINMLELNSNEKYYNLPSSLPTNSSNPGTIQNGDLMLYEPRR